MVRFLNNLTERMRANTDARRARIAERMQALRDRTDSRKPPVAHEEQQTPVNVQQQFSGYGSSATPFHGKESAQKSNAGYAAQMRTVHAPHQAPFPRNHQPQSPIAKRLNWWVAPVSAIGGMLITRTNTWPTIPVRNFMGGMGVKSEFLVFLPIGLVLLVLAAIVASALNRKLEKKSGDPS